MYFRIDYVDLFKLIRCLSNCTSNSVVTEELSKEISYCGRPPGKPTPGAAKFAPILIPGRRFQ